MRDRCLWCWGVTGQSFTCTCRQNCGATKCPSEVEGIYGYTSVPVPVFEQQDEETDSE